MALLWHIEQKLSENPARKIGNRLKWISNKYKLEIDDKANVK